MKYLNSKTRFIFIIVLSIIFSSCKKSDVALLKPGVSIELAQLRDNQIKNLKYNLSFSIPDSINKELTGNEILEFDFSKDLNEPLILDFRNPKSYVKSVKINEKSIKYRFENEHIIIPYSKLKDGKNQVEIEFIAGDRALNRNKEYLYTLFVPDRACTAFPCFDQPSLKGIFQTKITVPENWIAVSNSPLIETKETNDNRNIYAFEKSKLISTYLFSFTAGKFESVTRNVNDREITMFHREDDIEKLNNNIDKIFELHFSSLKWLEEYTQIEYPFKKFDFVIIPSFQYSGMEHPGAILYRDSRLFLDKNPTIREELDRANLIAHETAHMWFGDLVTMQWFSEVWLKEVFANFMAGKIINPQYPEINHNLNFLINHYPLSYSVDRTKGSNPIEQELDNMKNAGTLYGSIIYHKAPILMNQLEKIVGEELIQKGLQEYLNEYSFSNATWDNLVTILDKKIECDLGNWSNTWIYEPGMPSFNIQKAYNENNHLQSIIIEQFDPSQLGRQWTQTIDVLIAERNNFNTYQLELKDTFNVLDLENKNDASYIFPNSNGLGYGYFELDTSSIKNILPQLNTISDPVLKCSMYISLWENMLNQNIKPKELFNTYIGSLKTEANPQNISLVLGYSETIFWKFFTKDERNQIAHDLEKFIWSKIQSSKTIGIKKSYFNLYSKIVTTQTGVNKLYNIWKEDVSISDLNLSEDDFTDIAFELAVRDIKNVGKVLTEQKIRIINEEKKERFNFIVDAIINRDNFFKSLKEEKNREKEPWVIDALKYLHHPLKAEESVKYIIPSLEILEELQTTGDIFFPKRWLDAIFYGHSSIDAVMDINLFLNTHPDFPENLKNKIIQSTDLVFRSSIIKDE